MEKRFASGCLRSFTDNVTSVMTIVVSSLLKCEFGDLLEKPIYVFELEAWNVTINHSQPYQMKDVLHC